MIFSRLSGLGLLVVSLAIPCGACGKRSYVPVEADASAIPTASAVTVAPPLVVDGSSDAEDEAAEPTPPSPLATTCKGVSLVLVAVHVEKKPSYLTAVVELRSDSTEHVPLMLPGDGSTSGRRNPTLTYELTPDETTPLAGCGNMNGLSPANFAYLGPGERRSLDAVSLPWLPSKPGRYALRVTYRNDPTSTNLGDNRPGPAVDRLIARARKTVPCTLVSNTVAFTWTERTRERP